jgi:hypothetical protein
VPRRPQVGQLHEPQVGVGDLAFVDDDTGVDLARGDRVGDPVEGDDDRFERRQLELGHEIGGRELARDRHPASGEPLDRVGAAPPGDHDRAVPQTHGSAGAHDPVPVGEARVGVRAYGGHLDRSLERQLVQGLDVLEDVLDHEVPDRDGSGGETVEHEGVVGVGAVPNPKHAGRARGPGSGRHRGPERTGEGSGRQRRPAGRFITFPAVVSAAGSSAARGGGM